ncbi:hypothetical protein chiPu_0026934, partial [Chiloscyllium punctatum]|nr:hypothetical protein [Chiloscyllium punctatum]
MIGRKARLVAPIHRGVGGLDMTGEALGVEQRRRRPIGCQSRFERREPRWIGGKIDRHLLVSLRRFRNQLGQADRMEQARRDPADKRVAENGQHRQASPQRIAGGGVGVDGNVVEEQVGEAMAREMVGQRRPLCEHQALRSDAARDRLLAQICARLGVGFEQPQHAALDAAEDPHPPVEHAGRDLVVVVEAAEHEARRSQPHLAARKHAIGDDALVVIGLIAVGQSHHLLAVEFAMVVRDYGPIGDDVVDERGTERSRVT